VIRFLRARIQRKLILAFLIALIIPTTIITTYMLKASTDSLIKSAQHDELNELGLKAKATQKLLESVKSNALFLSQSPAIMSFAEAQGQTDKQVAQQFLSVFLKNSADLYKDLRVLNKDGMDILRIDAAWNPAGELRVVPSTDLENNATQPWYSETIKLKSGQVYISNLDLNTTQGKIDEPYVPVLRYATPIYTQSGDLTGVMVLKVMAATVFQPLQITSTTEGAYLTDKDGNYLLGVEPSKLYGNLLKKDITLFKDSPIDSKLFQSKLEGGLISTSEQPGVLQTFVHIQPIEQPQIDWILLERIPTSTLIGDLNNAPIVILIVAFLSLVIAIVTGNFVTRTIVQPISHLSLAMEAVGRGEADVMLPAYANREDEIGKLVTTFDKMTTERAVAYNKLQIRTRDLEVANKVAREANRLKSEFLSTMSHELRTPLNSIVGFTDILLTEKPGTINATQRTFLERVAGNNRRLLKLINDILDLSRIEAGRMEIIPITYSPRDMLERVSAQSSALFTNKKLKFDVVIADNLPSTVYGDRDRLEQVVVNLLSNAAKFTNEGAVVLSAARAKNNTWTIEVKDTGIGIAPHALEMIFEPFRQVDGSTSRQHGGSGLGLAIVRELCQMMNGQMQVQSELGKGSTFTVILPVTGQAETVGSVPANAVAA